MTTGKQYNDKFKSHLGQNGAKAHKYCHMSGGPWCCAEVSLVYGETDKKLFYGGKYCTYCPNAIKWAKAFLAQVPMYLALNGDLIFFDWNNNGVPDHIGEVDYKISNEKIATVEGNTGKPAIVRKKKRPAKYVLGVFRPLFVPPKNLKKSRLAVDGDFAYHSIYMLQVVLGMTPTGILTKETVKALQRKVGATPDGVWLEKTSRKVQKWTGAKVDGDFAVESVKSLQKKINSINYPQTTEKPPEPTPEPPAPTPQEKAIAWARSIAKDGSYKYVLWTKDKKTHLCPVCHPELKGKYHGWQCIGFVGAAYYHGAGLRCIKCECNGLGTNSFFTKVTEESWRKRNGKDWKMITNGGKKGGKSIPLDKLKAGDILICYDAKGVFHHIVMYTGNGMYIECTRGRKPQIGERPMSKLSKKHITRAFRYTGK